MRKEKKRILKMSKEEKRVEKKKRFEMLKEISENWR